MSINYENYDFTYFTYKEYDKMLDLMLYNIWKETYVSKEDLKQELIIFIMRLESKIMRSNSNIDNIKGYIIHCLKMKTRNLTKNFFKKIREENSINIELIEDIVCDDLDIEDYIVTKSYLNDLFDYYNVLKEDRELLLGYKDSDFKNERYLLLRWLRGKATKTDKYLWEY